MRPILNRTRAFFVISLSLLFSFVLAAGCSSDPQTKANRDVQRANENIAAHDKLFRESRDIYSQVQQSQQGESTSSKTTAMEGTEKTGPEGTQSTQTQSISKARNKLEKAKRRLGDARKEISGVQNLDVSDGVKEYSRTLEQALSDQITAEERELAFYEVLSGDPSLKDNRKQANGLLDEAKQGYEKAGKEYRKASKIADSNPRLVAPGSK